MISTKRFQIAQEAEKNSHVLKKGINVFEKRLSSAKNNILPYITWIEKELGRNGLSILDIGSGPTCLARFFRSGQKTYLDPLMDFFRDYYGPKALPGDGRLLAGLAEETGLPDASFDVVISFNMLDHTHQPRKIIKEIHRLLKPSGFFLLGLYTHGALLKWVRTLAEKSWVFKERPHPYSFTIGEVKRELEGPFELLKCDLIAGKENLFDFKRRFYILILRKR